MDSIAILFPERRIEDDMEMRQTADKNVVAVDFSKRPFTEGFKKC